MIAVRDKIIGTNETSIFEDLLKASTERNKGDRPANLILKFEGGEVIEPDFAGLRFDGESKQLIPSIELGLWQNFIFVMGLRKWLLFKSSPLEFLGRINLKREKNDDTGFYRTAFYSHNAVLIGVYEGGIVALSSEGEVEWHRKKNWEDEFLGIENGCLFFLPEAGDRFAVDASSGDDAATD